MLKHTSSINDCLITGASYATYGMQRDNTTTQKSFGWNAGVDFSSQGSYDESSFSGGEAAGTGSYRMASSSGLWANGSRLGLLPLAYGPVPAI